MANGPVTGMDGVRRLVEAAWADRSRLADPAHREAVLAAVAGLDRGELRVAEKAGGEWTVNGWLMQAVNLFFAVAGMETQDFGPFQVRDKIPLKKDLEAAGLRIVPGGIVRYGAYVAPGAVVMPGFVNIGARVGKGTMVDTWATVGSCAQVGENVHLAGGVGIGGVLEPPGARPNIIEDDCFIGSRCILVEGVLVEEGAVLGANVVITGSTPIIDVTGPDGGRAEEAGPGPLGGHPRDAPQAVSGRHLPDPLRPHRGTAQRGHRQEGVAQRRAAGVRGLGVTAPLAEALAARTGALCAVPSPIGEERALCDELEGWARGKFGRACGGWRTRSWSWWTRPVRRGRTARSWPCAATSTPCRCTPRTAARRGARGGGSSRPARRT